MRAGLKLFILGCLAWSSLPVTGLTKEAATAQHAAYSLVATAISTNKIRLDWQINDGFFLFQDKFQFNALTDGVALGEIELPPAEAHIVPHFGQLPIYRDDLTLDIPLIKVADEPEHLMLAVAAQGCESTETCYPTALHTLTLALAAAPEALSAAEQEEEFLEPDLAFAFSAVSNQPGTISVKWDIADKYYMYRDKFKFSLIDSAGNAITLP
ncbi:MAG: protein-disulfide reductase DsbD N-terminal domain-containing protein, partial [Pseudomonadota bacterium]